MALLQARAIENQAYVVGCNRVGEGGGLKYVGDSRIVDPLGELLATGSQGETILFADIDRRRRWPRCATASASCPTVADANLLPFAVGHMELLHREGQASPADMPACLPDSSTPNL